MQAKLNIIKFKRERTAVAPFLLYALKIRLCAWGQPEIYKNFAVSLRRPFMVMDKTLVFCYNSLENADKILFYAIRSIVMKNIIFKKLPAVLLAASLALSGALSAAAADSMALNGDGGLSQSYVSKVSCLTATAEEEKELAEFLSDAVFVFSSGKKTAQETEETGVIFDFSTSSYEDCLETMLFAFDGTSRLYDAYFTDRRALSAEEVSLPYEYSTAEGETSDVTYYAYSKENTDWIIRSVLNLDPSAVSSYKPEKLNSVRLYYSEDEYIAEKLTKELPGAEAEITSVNQRENGKYEVAFTLQKNGKTLALKAVAALKELSGVRRWTLYYLGDGSLMTAALRADPMLISVDNNSFPNASSSFISLAERNRYYMTAQDIEKLTASKSVQLRNAVYEYIIGGWDGSAYGISSAMALYFESKITKEQYSGDLTKDFYKLSSPVKDSALRSFINYCQAAQLILNKDDVSRYDEKLGSGAQEKAQVLKGAVASAQKEEAFILTCQWETASGISAQAFVCCGYSAGEDGAHRLVLIDPDNRYSKVYLEISSDYGECAFEGAYEGSSVFMVGCQSLNAAAYSGAAAENYEGRSLVILERNSEIRLTNAGGEELLLGGGEFSGNMEYRVEGYVFNGASNSAEMLVSVPESDSFIAETEKDTLDLTISGGNGIFCGVDGTNIQKVTVKKGEITVEGSNMAYSVSALSGQEEVGVVNIRGGETKRLFLAVGESVTVTSERRQNVKIALVLKDGTIKECDYLPGQFEYTVTTDLVDECMAAEKTNHIKVLVFFGCFACVIAMSAVVTVIIVSDRRKKQKTVNEAENTENTGNTGG